MTDSSSPIGLPPSTSPAARRCAVVVVQLALTALVAWLAFEMQQVGIAPAVLFPLLVGAAVGGGQWIAERVVDTRSGGARLPLALVLGLLAVVAQEGIGYVKVYRPAQAARGRDPRMQFFGDDFAQARPLRFDQFVARRFYERPLWWTLDLALTAVGSVAAARWIGSRRAATFHSTG